MTETFKFKELKPWSKAGIHASAWPESIFGALCLAAAVFLLFIPASLANAPPSTSAVKVGLTEQATRTLFSQKDGLTGDQVRSISISQAGETYLATEGGLSFYDGLRWSRFTQDEGLASNDLRFVTVVSPKTLQVWMMGTADGLQMVVPTLSNSANMPKTRWLKGTPLVDMAMAKPYSWAISGEKIHMADERTECEVKPCWEEKPAPPVGTMRAVLSDSKGVVWVGGDDGLAKTSSQGAAWEKLEVAENGLASNQVRDLFEDAEGNLWIATSKGLNRFAADGTRMLFDGKAGLPVEDLTCVTAKDGDLWVGSTSGAARLHEGRWEYYQGPRWLPDDRVLSIGVEDTGFVWIGTMKGAARIEFRQMYLEEKSDYFVERIQNRHIRHGLVGSCEMPEPERYEECRQHVSDNDGLWTGIYVAAESFRYAATGDEQAKRNARRSLDALIRLETIAPGEGFFARSLATAEEDAVSRGGEWHFTPDGKWQWKGDTSSDEADGHFFAYGIYYDLAADEEEKKELRTHVGRIMDHIIDNGYYLIDVDGKPTTWGRWSPEYFESDGLFQRGLNSLEILSFLMTAHHITGNPRYLNEYRRLADEQRYKFMAEGVRIQFPAYNHSDDELAFLVFYPILKYETDPNYRKHILRGLEQTWDLTQKERCPLWNFIYATAGTGKNARLDDAVRTLVEIPLDVTHWPLTNSARADLKRFKVAGIPAESQPPYLLSRRNAPVMKWNGDPYGLDYGGDGREEDDGAFWLLPYWMGRHHGFIVEE